MPNISCLFFYYLYNKREKIKRRMNGGKLHLLKAPYLYKIYTRYGHEILNTYLLLHSLSDTTSLIPK